MRIVIEGMRSAECVKRVRAALQKIDGLQVREIVAGSATVDGDSKQQAAALDAIEKAGYQPHISS